MHMPTSTFTTNIALPWDRRTGLAKCHRSRRRALGRQPELDHLRAIFVCGCCSSRGGGGGGERATDAGKVAEGIAARQHVNPAEIAASLLLATRELRFFFEKSADMQGGRCRTDLENFLVMVTERKAVVPLAQRRLKVRAFVGEICLRARSSKLLWEDHDARAGGPFQQ